METRADPIEVAIVGTGFGARVQLPVLSATPGLRVRCLVGRDRSRTEQIASAHGVAIATTDLAQALDDPRIALVVIATPPDRHAIESAAALAAGKHVLCEKPLAQDAATARAMVDDAARAAPRLALVDHQLRFAPALRRMQRLLGDGYLGTLLYGLVDVATGRELEPEREYGWWHERARGGGALGAYGSHAIDLVRLLCGEIESVSGTLHTFGAERVPRGELRRVSVDADDWAAAWLTCGRVRVGLQISAVAVAGTGLRLELFGTEGRLLLDTEGALLGRHRSGGLETLVDSSVLPATLRGRVPDTLWTAALADFAVQLQAAIASGSDLVPGAATFHDGWRVQRVLDAVRESAPDGHRVDLG